MGGGAERVSDDKEGDIFVLGGGVDAVRLRLDHVAIGQDDVLAVESLLRVHAMRCTAVVHRPHVHREYGIQCGRRAGSIVNLRLNVFGKQRCCRNVRDGMESHEVLCKTAQTL